MPDHEEIYFSRAEAYHAMISRQPDLSGIVKQIKPYRGLDVLDLGAGTGRLSAFLAAEAKSLICTDASRPMLDLLDRRLHDRTSSRNWTTMAADHRKLPIPDSSVDLAVSGWSVCYLANADVPDWEQNLEQILAELRRVLRPDGTIILFETMGTGTESPNPPSFLKPYYARLENRYGFRHRGVRADYSFESADEAVRHTAFFFGDDLARTIGRNRWATVPECAGIWWKHLADEEA